MRNLWILFVAALAFSCGKDSSAESGQGPAISLNDALTSRKWMITGLILTSSDGGYVNLFAVNFKACEKDDLLNFGTNGIFTKSDGVSICNPPGNSVFNNLNGGTWTSSPDSSLKISQGFNVQQYKVTKWTSSSMTWEQSQTNYAGVKESYTYQLISQ